jgi:uncharacterized protein with HEPN domain
MSNRIPSTVIGDILRCIDHVEKYTTNLSFDEFLADFMVIEAWNVIKNDLPGFKQDLKAIQIQLQIGKR